MSKLDIPSLDFTKLNGLIPAVIQDNLTLQVLMVGFMNREALEQTQKNGKVTFFSRTKNRLWEKGETSGHSLLVQRIEQDCDNDTLLVFVTPTGPACHRGTPTCFQDKEHTEHETHGIFLRAFRELIQTIDTRATNPSSESYTTKLLQGHIKRIAQKVGEEGVEVALAGLAEEDEAFLGEMTDLLYHLFVLLKARGCSTYALAQVINERRK